MFIRCAWLCIKISFTKDGEIEICGFFNRIPASARIAMARTDGVGVNSKKVKYY
jgi:hypothetical protein